MNKPKQMHKTSVYFPIFILVLFSCTNIQNTKHHNENSDDSLYVQSYSFILRYLSPKNIKQLNSIKEAIENDIKLSINISRESLENKTISVNCFNEFVLPPTIFNEPIENWREVCYKKCKYLQKMPFQIICDTLNYQIKRNFEFGKGAPHYTSIGWNMLNMCNAGDCFHIAKILTYELRSIGIPASIDIASWGNSTGTHCWTVAWDNGKMRPFMETQEKGVTIYSPFIVYENKRNKEQSVYRYPAKVHRKTYSINRDIEKIQQLLDLQDIPPILLDNRVIDVSSDYFETIDLVYNLTSKNNNQKVIFLSTYSKKWKIAVAALHNCNTPVVFKKINPDILYMPSFYHNKTEISAGAPIIITKNGSYRELIPNFNQEEDLYIEYLYPLLMEYSNAWGKLDKLPSDYLEELPTGKYRKVPINGETYILYYWNNGDWNALQETEAKQNRLIFNNVPSNTLFILGDQNGKHLGRPFTIDNKNLKWW